MEHCYTGLKRSTLKDLLEARGQGARNKTKATLIAELMEGDQASNAPSPASEVSELQREVQWRLALYGDDPPHEIISQVLREVTQTQAQREATQAQAQREATQAQREATQLRLAELQRDREAAVVQPAEPARRGKKLPYNAFRTFQDGEDEMDIYLQMFERQCALQGVEESEWVTLLVSKLTGRAAEAYHSIPEELSRDYDRVKERLLLRFGITPEAHRLKFRSLKRKDGQPYTEWAYQMSRAAESWMDGCQAVSRADALDIILLEQFYNYAPPAVRDWVRDRQPLTVDKAAVLADQYADSRRSIQPEPSAALMANPPAPQNSVSARQPAPQCPVSPPPPRRSGIRCFGCDQVGHVRRDCPQNAGQDSGNCGPDGPNRAAAHCLEAEERDDLREKDIEMLHEADPVQAASTDNRLHHCQAVWIHSRPAQGLRGSPPATRKYVPARQPAPWRPVTPPSPRRSGIRCFRCHQVGHISSNCSRKASQDSWNRWPAGPTRAAAHCLEAERRENLQEEDMGILHEVDPVQAASTDNLLRHRQAVWINGRPAQGLRDTGATITLVQPRLITAEQQTGRFGAVRVAGGTLLRIPMARVCLDWGVGTKEVEVGLMRNLPTDVLLGNDLGGLNSAFTLNVSPDTSCSHPSASLN